MAPRPPTTADWLRLIGLTACWGTAFLFNEFALEAFPPTQIVALRVIVGVLLLGGYAKLTGVRLPRSGDEWRPMAVMAMFGVIVPFLLTVQAQVYLPSATTAVLMAVMPLIVMTLAHFFVPGERLSRAKVAGFGVGFTGVALVVGPESLGGQAGTTGLVACGAVLLAAISYAASSVYARIKSRTEPLASATGMLLLAMLITVPVAATDPLPSLTPLPVMSMLAVVVLGAFATGLASVLYFQVVAGPGPSFLSLVNYLVPGWGVVLGMLVLNERLSSWAVLGLGLILVGIGLSEFGHRWITARTHSRQSTQSGATTV